MERGIWEPPAAGKDEPPTDIRKWPPVVDWSGNLGCMDYAVAIMFHLGNVLLPDDEKVRVTIERDPEAGKFTIKRETIT